MKRLFFLSAASLLLVGLLNPATSLGQQPTTQAGHDHDHDHGDHDHGSETLAFCLTDWKTLHFDDANKAQQHLDMVKKLGCEVKQGKHSGHIDVSYRCPNWKSMQVETHKLAEQWLGWLKGSLVNWKSIHGNGSAQEKQLVDALTALGVEVVKENHGNHSDIRYRSPVWRDVHVADHAAADKLMAWLKQSGFEVAEHKH